MNYILINMIFNLLITVSGTIIALKFNEKRAALTTKTVIHKFILGLVIINGMLFVINLLDFIKLI